MVEELLKQIECMGILPVIKLNDAKDAVPLAKALCEGGLPCAEVTFRTDAAKESIAEMTKDYPEMLVGAGTVLNTEQVDAGSRSRCKIYCKPGTESGHSRVLCEERDSDSSGMLQPK